MNRLSEPVSSYGPRFADSSCVPIATHARIKPLTLKHRGPLMGYLKFAIVAFAVTLFATPSSVEAQNFQQLGLRRGAVTGAILGAVIGDQNNEALAGAAIGGLVGGTIGNVSGRNLDRQFYGGQPVYGYGGGNRYYSQPVYRQADPVYRPAPAYRPAYGGSYGYGRPGCGGRGW